MWIAEAKVDPKLFSWFTFNGPKAIKLGRDQEFNQKHPLQVRPGELVGLKKATRGPGAGNYQVLLGHAVHVVFRNVPQKMIDKLVDHLKPHKGTPPEHGQLQEGQKRNRKVQIRDKIESDKQRDDFYRPTGAVREHSTYDRLNYQWRKVVHAGTPIKSLKQGRSKYSLQQDDIVGVRYMTKARGGFIILPNGQRVNISHDTYEAVVGSTRILPSSKQQKGIVIIADVKAALPKQTRIRKPKEEEPDVRRVPRDAHENRTGTRIKRDIQRGGLVYKHEDIPDVEMEDDEDEDLDDIAEQEESPTVPLSHQPVSVLKVGTKIKSAKRSENEFIVVDVRQDTGYTEFSLYSPLKKDVRKLRIGTDVDMSTYRSVIPAGEADKSELAAGKRAFNKAVKDKKFTIGSIHDQ